jgi:hypothetical protein
VYTFRNIGQGPARALILNAPETAHVGSFSQAGQLMPPRTKDLLSSGPPDVPRLLEIGQQNGIQFLVPQH